MKDWWEMLELEPECDHCGNLQTECTCDEPPHAQRTSRHVEWAEQWGEWIVVVGDIGYRYHFDCKAEAQEYVRLTQNLDHEGYVWRRLGLWSMNHKHNYECAPHWQRGTNEHNN